MNKLDKAVADLKSFTPILMYTTNISDVSTEQIWSEIRSLYETTQSPLSKVLVSILNSIATQNRSYFCITREKVRFLIKNDVNWHDEKPEFGNDSWKTILRLLHDTGIAILEAKGTGRRPSVYKLGNVWHKMVDSCTDTQRNQTMDFVKKRSSADDNRT